MAMSEEEVRQLLSGSGGGGDGPLSAEEARRIYFGTPARPGSGKAPIERVPGSLMRGLEDAGEGVKQLFLQLTDPDRAAEYTEQVNRERAEFAESGENEPISRFIGQALPLLPLAAVPGGGSANLLTRLAAGAAAGGAAGGAQFAPSGTMRERGLNTALGTAGGALAPEAVRGITRGGSALMRSLFGRTGASDDALARQADFEALGVRPTTGQVTRNPRALAEERNVAQIPGVGDRVRAVRAGQAPRLAEALDEAVPGESVTQTEAGRRIMGTLGTRFDDEGIYRQMGRQIDDLFSQARNAAGADDVLDADAFTSRISSTLDDFEDVIPQPVKTRLSQFGDERPMTVGEAFKLRQLLNARSRNTTDPATGAAMSAIKGELDDFLAEAGEQGVGGDALTLFQRANDASRRRARAFSGDLQKVVDDRVAPDDFVRRHIIGGNVDDIRQMRVTLLRKGGERGQSAWDTARRQVVDYLQDKSVSDTGNFSASRYNSALDRLGRDKLEVLFEDAELGQLERIGRAATNLFSDPPSGGIPIGNRSGTAAGNIANIPGGGFMERISRGRAANRALQGSPVDRLGQGQRNSMIADMVTNPMGTNPFAAPGGLLGLLGTRRVLEGNDR